MVVPDEVVGLAQGRIHQQQGALEILHQRPIAQLGHVAQQMAVQTLRLVGVAAGVEQDEGLAQLHVPRAVGIDQSTGRLCVIRMSF